MQVKDLMDPSIVTIQGQATVLEAAEKMQQFDAHALVVKVGTKPCGVVTEQDIARTVLREGSGMDSATHIGRVMTTAVAACYEDTEIESARAFMKKHRIRGLLVCDRQKQMVGFLAPEQLETMSS